MTETMRTGV